MKRIIAIVILLTGYFGAIAQNRHLFRIYEDNDFINLAGKGTDKGYTNGTRFDYFFVKEGRSRFFIDRWLPKAGKNAVNTFNYSASQAMFVPMNISTPEPDKSDWPYSGTLVLTHGVHSSNPVKKILIRTEIVGGVIGPAAMARPTQIWIHKMINATKPMGWDKQMPNDILLNLNVLAEKMIWQHNQVIELIGGGELNAGTMLDGASASLQLRVGKMKPYFGGYTDMFSSARNNSTSRIQYYLFLIPAAQWHIYNALFDGGVFSGKSDYYKNIGDDKNGKVARAHQLTALLNIGATLVLNNVSLSISQKQISPTLVGIADQTIGNVSLTIGW